MRLRHQLGAAACGIRSDNVRAVHLSDDIWNETVLTELHLLGSVFFLSGSQRHCYTIVIGSPIAILYADQIFDSSGLISFDAS